MAANPFLAPSPLPFGYPDFSAIREEHFLPAFVEGMARQRAEVDAIAADPAPPTFENTLVALERSGDVLRRVSAVFFVLAASSSTEGIRAVETEVAPLLAAHADAIRLDPALFARIEAIAAEGGVGGAAGPTAAAGGEGPAGGESAAAGNGAGGAAAAAAAGGGGVAAVGGGGVAAVGGAGDASPGGRSTEDRRLVERYHRDAVRAGARLGQAEQERL